jgi:hypothetical protein
VEIILSDFPVIMIKQVTSLQKTSKRKTWKNRKHMVARFKKKPIKRPKKFLIQIIIPKVSKNMC